MKVVGNIASDSEVVATADGAITAGKPVIVNSNGTVTSTFETTDSATQALGTEITFDLSPVVNDFANPMATPAVVPTPTCSSGLKKTISLILDSNGAVIKSISKLSGTVKTGVESV